MPLSLGERRKARAARRFYSGAAARRAVEVLEARLCLAAVLGGDGTLSVSGTDVANVIALGRAGDQIVVTVDGASESFAAASVRRVEVRALGGTDSTTLAAGFSGAVSPLPVTVDGGAGSADALVVNGSGGEDRLDVTPTSVAVAPKGSAGGVAVSFTGVEKFTADAGAGADEFSLSDALNGFGQQFALVGGEGDDTFTVGDPARANAWTGNTSLAGGAGQDSVTYNDQALAGDSIYHGYRVAPFVLSRGPFNFEQTGFERVTLNASNSADYIEVLHSPGTEMWVNAGAQAGSNPRTERSEDVLWLSDTFNASNAVLTMAGPDSGQYTFPGSQFLPIHFTDVEALRGADVTRPRVTDSAFRAVPRQEIELRFSEDVRASLVASDVTLVNVATGRDVPANFQRYFSSPQGAPTVAQWVPADPLPPGEYRATLPAAAVQDAAGNKMAEPVTLVFTVPTPSAAVAGRHVFYNNSVFDRYDQTVDDNLDAIAPDKTALLPGGTPAFANVTSYAKGINGIMIDMAGVPRGWNPPLRDLDFVFDVSDAAAPGGWAPAPRPSYWQNRAGTGAGGSDRTTFLWADGAIRNQWLRVTVPATGRTGLAAPDVFYFGNLVGESGDVEGLRVNALDLSAVKRALNTDSTVAGRFDFNRDGKVNALDVAAVRSNLNHALRGAIPAPTVAAAPSAAVERVWDEAQSGLPGA